MVQDPEEKAIQINVGEKEMHTNFKRNSKEAGWSWING